MIHNCCLKPSYQTTILFFPELRLFTYHTGLMIKKNVGSYLWLMTLFMMAIPLRAQKIALLEVEKFPHSQTVPIEDINDTTNSKIPFARNLVFLNVSIYSFPSIGLSYEHLFTENLSVSMGISTPYFQTQVNAIFSLWLNNHRFYSGINGRLLGDSEQLGHYLYWGIKFGYQYHPRDGGFSFGLNVAQWFLEYNLPLKIIRLAPLTNPASIRAPLLEFNLGYVF